MTKHPTGSGSNLPELSAPPFPSHHLFRSLHSKVAFGVAGGCPREDLVFFFVGDLFPIAVCCMPLFLLHLRSCRALDLAGFKTVLATRPTGSDVLANTALDLEPVIWREGHHINQSE